VVFPTKSYESQAPQTPEEWLSIFRQARRTELQAEAFSIEAVDAKRDNPWGIALMILLFKEPSLISCKSQNLI
jgi:hypothetical protein